MPTYDYECSLCGFTFETFQSMSATVLKDCPKCQKPELRRLISGGSGIIFKGGGFYVNDSRPSSSSKENSQKSPSSSPKKSPSSSSDSTKKPHKASA